MDAVASESMRISLFVNVMRSAPSCTVTDPDGAAGPIRTGGSSATTLFGRPFQRLRPSTARPWSETATLLGGRVWWNT